MIWPGKRLPILPVNPARSEPQIDAASTLTSTSSGRSSGSGTSAIAMELGPCQMTARMDSLIRPLREMQ